MFSVALIGSDGAGKSTIAQRLEKSFPLPVKCLYMGINFESSNVTLPTSRLIHFLRRIRRNRADARQSGHPSSHLQSTNKSKAFSKLWKSMWLANQLAEEWYRQLLSWNYQRKGRIVVYDRHFKFDFECDNTETDGHPLQFVDQVHRWFLGRLYPRPDLVIYLDAPAEVLFARKGEATLQWLESRRQSFLRLGQQTPNFVKIDASRPLEIVYTEVAKHIMQFHG